MTDVSRGGQSPFAQWELVTVAFAVADADQEVVHHLVGVRPVEIGYVAVGQTGSGKVYHASTDNWTHSRLVLRCSYPQTVQLLLVAFV